MSESRVNNPSLVIFDVDGTLTQTNEIDEACFVRAIEAEFGIRDINTDWSVYRRSTDSGIVDQLIQERFGRFSKPRERSRVKEKFVELLIHAFSNGQASCSRTPGSRRAIERLRGEPGWCLAVATGGWEESIRLKLGFARLDVSDIPIASSNDSMARERIIELAIKRAAKHYQAEDFKHVVYIGDGIWDVRAARALGISFVGVAEGQREEILKIEGAGFVIPHFKDLDQLLEAMQEAPAPLRPR